MKKRWFFLLLCLAVSACSMGIGQTTDAIPSARPTVDVPSLGFTGKLVYGNAFLQDAASPFSIQILDLKMGENKTVFTAPAHSWVYYLTVSPYVKQALISYVPPSDSVSASDQTIYSLPLDGSAQPQEIITPPTDSDRYTQVEWSPDGKYIYFAHTNTKDQPAGQLLPNYEIYRMTYPDGEPEKIVDHAFWPRISPDSSKLVYISLDPNTGENGLFVANANGSDSRKIILSGPMAMTPTIKDAPLFLPDEQTVLFSAPAPAPSYQPDWFEKLTGVQVAKAHNVPSDWWSVSVNGGTPTQLTHLQTTGLFASISPDGQHLASMSGEGIFVMGVDGTGLTRVLSDISTFGTVAWIP